MQPPSPTARSAPVDESPAEVGSSNAADTKPGPATPPSRTFFRPGPGWFDIEGRKVGRERAAVDAAQRVLVAAQPADEAPTTSRTETGGPSVVPSAVSSAVAGSRSEPPVDVASGPKLYFRSSPGWFDRKGGRYRAPLNAREHRLAADATRDAATAPRTVAEASPGGAKAKTPGAPFISSVRASPAKAPGHSTPPSTPAPAVVRAGPREVTETGRLSADKPSSASTTAPSLASPPVKPVAREAAIALSPAPDPAGIAPLAKQAAVSPPPLAPVRSADAPARSVAPGSFPEPASPESSPAAAAPATQTSALSAPAPSTPVAAPADGPAEPESSRAPVTAATAAPSPAVPQAASIPTLSQRGLPEVATPVPVAAAAPPLAPAAPQPGSSQVESQIELRVEPHDAAPPAATAPDRDARPASLEAPRDGRADDLKQIKGIGPKNEASCHALGVYHIDQIAGWSAANAAWVGHHVAFPGRIERERWIDQAKLLAIGVDTPHAAGVRAGTIVVDDAADAPLSEAEIAALVTAMPALTPAVANEHLHPGTRPVGLVAARGGTPDDLQRIRGIGPQNETRLRALGIWHFAQIAAWTPDHVKWMGSYLAFPGRIAREAWIMQAAALAAGGSPTAPKPRGRQRG